MRIKLNRHAQCTVQSASIVGGGLRCMAAACGNISLSSPRLVSLTSHTWTPHLHLLLGMVQVSDKINKDILGKTRLTLKLGPWNFFLQYFLLLGFGLIQRENLSAFGRDCFLDVLISPFDLDIKIQAANHILKIRHPSKRLSQCHLSFS